MDQNQSCHHERTGWSDEDDNWNSTPISSIPYRHVLIILNHDYMMIIHTMMYDDNDHDGNDDDSDKDTDYENDMRNLYHMFAGTP